MISLTSARFEGTAKEVDMRNLVSFVVIVMCLFSASYAGAGTRWYKGNTHAHTVLCGHADSTPEEVTKWYHDHGYHFLILSDHNKFIDPDKVKLPRGKRRNFILIPGEEVTGAKGIHTTAMNIHRLVPWRFDHPHKSAIIQNHVDEAIDAGGTTILNHPNYGWTVRTADILPVRRLYMFELFNGHPAVRNHGDHHHLSTEALWDELLTQGMVMYGVSSDDAHVFKEWGPGLSNSGRGWVMVRAAELTRAAITKAMQTGDFYASNGVILKEVSLRKGVYSVEVDRKATERELSSSILFGKRTEESSEGYRVEFIGPKGKVLKTETSAKGAYSVRGEDAYVRCRVTYSRRNGDTNQPFNEEFYAWTQPVFTDGRIER